jgi:hypothetical protein
MTSTPKATQSDVLLTPDEAAAYLKLSKSWLAKARLNGNGPAYSKLGGRVRYSAAVLQLWVKANQQMSTSM